MPASFKPGDLTWQGGVQSCCVSALQFGEVATSGLSAMYRLCMGSTIRQHTLLQVTLVHLYQAGMFADLDQINAVAGVAPGASSASVAGAKVSAAEAPLKEEVQHKLQHLLPALLNTCQQVCVHLCLSVRPSVRPSVPLCHSVLPPVPCLQPQQL